MKYILALDQGTTSCRAALVTDRGQLHATAHKEFSQKFPSPGWVEHDPHEIWTSQAACMTEVLAKSKVSPAELLAIGISNQRETTLIWERATGRPLMNAIVWQDRRTTEECQRLKQEGVESVVREKTGLLLDPYFSATKIAWILQTIPGARERAERGELAFGTVDSWIVWQLTSGHCHATDVTNASRTLLFNLHTLDWDDELLNIFNIPRSLLPKVHPSSHLYAVSNTPMLSASVPIAAIAGDQQAALVGQACFKPGMVKSTYGTGCFMLMNVGSRPVLSTHHLLTTVAYQVKKEIAYALEGSVFIGGAVVQWLRDNLKLFSKASEIEKLAASVPDSGGVYFVPSFTGLGAPYWDPYARGAILGLTRGSTSAHLARGAIDSIAHQVTDVLQAMEGDAQCPISEIRVDGGAVRNSILLQLQADLMRTAVIRPKLTELTVQGAAYLAGLEMGLWPDFQAISKLWEEEDHFTAKMPLEEVRTARQAWMRAIDCTRSWTASRTV